MRRQGEPVPGWCGPDSARSVAAGRSPGGAVLSAALFPALAGAQPPSARPRMLLLPLLCPPVAPEVPVESP